jgi:hypothetical protein
MWKLDLTNCSLHFIYLPFYYSYQIIFFTIFRSIYQSVGNFRLIKNDNEEYFIDMLLEFILIV